MLIKSTRRYQENNLLSAIVTEYIVKQIEPSI